MIDPSKLPHQPLGPAIAAVLVILGLLIYGIYTFIGKLVDVTRLPHNSFVEFVASIVVMVALVRCVKSGRS